MTHVPERPPLAFSSTHTSSLSARPRTDSLFLFQCSDGNSAQENCSLKRVAVVEDFFDIIYAMHVEMGADPGRAPKHAGQKKTYKAVSMLSKAVYKNDEDMFTIQQTIIKLSRTSCRYMDLPRCSKGHKTYLLKCKSFQTMTGAEYRVMANIFINQVEITCKSVSLLVSLSAHLGSQVQLFTPS